MGIWIRCFFALMIMKWNKMRTLLIKLIIPKAFTWTHQTEPAGLLMMPLIKSTEHWVLCTDSLPSVVFELRRYCTYVIL